MDSRTRNPLDGHYPELKRPKIVPNQKSEFAAYYVMSSAVLNHDLKKVSPFLIEKSLSSTIGDGSTTKRLRDGTLLIKCKNEKQATKLMAMTTLGGLQAIKVQEHRTLNECKGTVFCHDLKYIPEEEILAELASQRVTAVRKMKKKIDGMLVDTALCVVTFKTATLPEFLRVGFHHCSVKMYIPNPLRCLKCFKYGHPKKDCLADAICALCSSEFHEGNCQSAHKCVNCKEPNNNHNNWSKDCKRYKMEQEIQKISTVDKISNFEARRKFKLIHPDFSYPTYANTLNGIAFMNTNTNAQSSITVNHQNPSSSSRTNAPNKSIDLNKPTTNTNTDTQPNNILESRTSATNTHESRACAPSHKEDHHHIHSNVTSPSRRRKLSLTNNHSLSLTTTNQPQKIKSSHNNDQSSNSPLIPDTNPTQIITIPDSIQLENTFNILSPDMDLDV